MVRDPRDRNRGDRNVTHPIRTPEEEAAFHERRKKGIGSSDAAGVLGLSRWTSALELYGVKTGEIEPEDISDVDAVIFGNLLEDVVAKEFARRNPDWNVDETIPEHVSHPTRTWQLAHPDRYIYRPNDHRKGVMEVKTASAFKAEEWKEEAPVEYQVQAQHQLSVTGLEWGVFAVLLGGQKFFWLPFEFNDRFEKVMVKRERAFWDGVESRTPPSLSHVEADARALAALYDAPKATEPVLLDPLFLEWDAKLREAKQTIKEAKANKQEAENHLKAAIGNEVVAMLPDGASYSWKQQHRDAHQVAESDFRVLRRHAPKR